MMKRLAREVGDLQRGDLSGIGIYTWFDETNMRNGKAMIIGPEGTPYAFCPLFFDINIPNEYPLVPPKVEITTTDNSTRLHPNLYTGGKVCLSILGTYTGPSWVSTMNIECVLKSILSLLTENPITNEPGFETYTLENLNASAYATYVQFAMARITVEQYRQFKVGGGHPLWDPFREVLLTVWERVCLPRLREIITEVSTKTPAIVFPSLLYGMSNRTANWKWLRTLAEQKLEMG